MFKRNDESEWARFSKAFPQGKDDKKDSGDADVSAVVSTPRVENQSAAPIPADERAAPAPVAAPPAQRILSENNVGLSRPTAATLTTAQVFSEEVESTIG